jgi:hypothetical protein
LYHRSLADLTTIAVVVPEERSVPMRVLVGAAL